MLLLCLASALQAQDRWPTSKIYHELQKLLHTPRVLYIAAHPDDENTRMIGWLENHRHAEVAYLSLTRGDGGQNLIGPELGIPLGLIRSRELLEARAIDGGKQFFSRARDFGYSKTYTETFDIWEKEAVLKDVVRVIREFRPHLILTRFSPEPGGTHGHHTASAILAMEAFDLAADPKAYPDCGKAWTTERLLWNTSWWFFRRSGQSFVPDTFLRVPTGHYVEELGLSCPEIAAYARSQHKSQGFGTTADFADTLEYFQHLKGSRVSKDLLEGIPQSLEDLPGGKKADALIKQLLKSPHNFGSEASLELLLECYDALADLEDPECRKEKQELCAQLIFQSMGLKVDALATQETAVAGDTLSIHLRATAPKRLSEVVLRSSLSSKALNLRGVSSIPDLPLEGWLSSLHIPVQVLPKAPISQPYWLESLNNPGLFTAQTEHIGKAWNDPVAKLLLSLEVKGSTIKLPLEVRWEGRDRAKGALNYPFRIYPALSVQAQQEAYVNVSGSDIELSFKVKNHSSMPKTGSLSLELSEGWKQSEMPSQLSLSPGQESLVRIKVRPKGDAQQGIGTAKATWRDATGQKFHRGLEYSLYDHIGPVEWFPEAACRLVHLPLTMPWFQVAYLPGAGDETATYLEKAGLKIQEVSLQKLLDKQVDAPVLLVGIRAMNVAENPANLKRALEDYAREGGTVIMQYNTSWGLDDPEVLDGLSLSRNRITDETAPLSHSETRHMITMRPLPIQDQDFEGWVQERGLYFAGKWSPEWADVLRGADPGEEEVGGMLMVRSYGKGTLIYTGLSFFRQLPAGVPGAYKLLFNMLQYGQQ